MDKFRYKVKTHKVVVPIKKKAPKEIKYLDPNPVPNKSLLYYIDIIRKAPICDLHNCDKLEKLICKCGLSNDDYMMRELLPQYLQYTGYGLHIQQNPKELSEYLLKISKLSIIKYL